MVQNEPRSSTVLHTEQDYPGHSGQTVLCHLPASAIVGEQLALD